jgi:hypothetical protein
MESPDTYLRKKKIGRVKNSGMRREIYWRETGYL